MEGVLDVVRWFAHYWLERYDCGTLRRYKKNRVRWPCVDWIEVQIRTWSIDGRSLLNKKLADPVSISHHLENFPNVLCFIMAKKGVAWWFESYLAPIIHCPVVTRTWCECEPVRAARLSAEQRLIDWDSYACKENIVGRWTKVNRSRVSLLVMQTKEIFCQRCHWHYEDRLVISPSPDECAQVRKRGDNNLECRVSITISLHSIYGDYFAFDLLRRQSAIAKLSVSKNWFGESQIFTVGKHSAKEWKRISDWPSEARPSLQRYSVWLWPCSPQSWHDYQNSTSVMVRFRSTQADQMYLSVQGDLAGSTCGESPNFRLSSEWWALPFSFSLLVHLTRSLPVCETSAIHVADGI